MRNLNKCLRGIAQEWYIGQLTGFEREYVKKDHEVVIEEACFPAFQEVTVVRSTGAGGRKVLRCRCSVSAPDIFLYHERHSPCQGGRHDHGVGTANLEPKRYRITWLHPSTQHRHHGDTR